MKTKIKQTLLFAALSTSLFSTSGALAASTSDIVGGWYATHAGQSDGDVALTFTSDGNYFMAHDGSSVLDPSGQPGMERGIYNWNSSTGALSWTTQSDTNGEWGLSHSTQGAIFQVIGNSVTVGSTTFARVSNPSNLIVGSWSGGNVVFTFLSNGEYFMADDSDPALDPSGQKGIERGTYTWDSVTGAFTHTTQVDTNGQWGLSHARDVNFLVNGDILTGNNFEGTFAFTRVAAVPVPAAAWLMGSGLLGLIGVARRKAA